MDEYQIEIYVQSLDVIKTLSDKCGLWWVIALCLSIYHWEYECVGLLFS